MDAADRKPENKLKNSRQTTKPIKKVTLKGVIKLSTTEVKTKAKRPSKGLAKHNRLVKQEARRTSVPGTEIKKKKRVILAAK
jgi:hypothetical protein